MAAASATLPANAITTAFPTQSEPQANPFPPVAHLPAGIATVSHEMSSSKQDLPKKRTTLGQPLDEARVGACHRVLEKIKHRR